MSSSTNGGFRNSGRRCGQSAFEMVHSPAFSPSKILPRLRPPQAPTFPTLWQLAGAQMREPDRPKTDGLFEQLIGEPLLLFQSLLDDPNAFEPGVSELLQDLINKHRELSNLNPEEHDLLNRAAIDFATTKRPTPRHPSPSPTPQRLPAAARMAVGEEEPELEYREHSRPVRIIEIPDEPPTFWWRKAKK